MKFDVGSNYTVAEEIAALSHATGAVNGVGVDHAEASSVVFHVSCGDVGASGTLDAKVQHSPDNSTWTDDDGLSGNDLAITQLVAAGSAVLKVSAPQDRYSRVLATVGVNAVVASVTSVLGMNRHVAA